MPEVIKAWVKLTGILDRRETEAEVAAKTRGLSADVKLGLNDKDAEVKLDSLKAGLIQLGRQTATARAKLDVDDKAGAAKLAALQVRLAALNKRVTAPEFKLEGVDRAEAQLLGLDAQLDRIGTKTVQTGSKFNLIGTGAALAGSLALPALAGITAAAAGVGAVTAASGAVFAVFGGTVSAQLKDMQTSAQGFSTLQKQINKDAENVAIAKTAIANAQGTKQLTAAQGQLSAASKTLAADQRKLTDAQAAFNRQFGPAATGFEHLTAAWDKWKAATKDQSLSLIGQGMNLLAQVLPKLKPLFDVGAQYASKFLGIISDFVKSGGADKLVGMLAGLARQVGDKLGPVIGQILIALGKLFVELIPAGVKILGALGTGFSALLTAVTPILVPLANVTATFLTWLAKKDLLVAAIGAVAGAFFLASGSTGIGAVVIAAAGVITAVEHMNSYLLSDGKTGAAGLAGTLSSIIPVKQIEKDARSVIDFLAGLFGQVKTVSPPIQISPLGKKLPGEQQNISAAAQIGVNLRASLIAGFQGQGGGPGGLGDVSGQLARVITGWILAAGVKIKWFDIGRKLGSDAAPFIIGFTVGLFTGGHTESLTQGFTGFIKTAFRNLNMSNLAQPLINLAHGIVDGFIGAIEKQFHLSQNGVFNAAKEVVHGIATAFSLITQFMTNPVAAGIKGIIALLKAVHLDSIGRDIVRGLWNGMVAVWNGLTRFIRSIPGAIIGMITGPLGIHSPSSVMYRIGADILAGLWNGIRAVWNGFIRFVQSIPRWIVSVFNGAGAWLWNQGYWLLKGFWNGIVRVWQAVYGWFRGLPHRILQALGIASPPAWAIEAGGHIMGGILKGLAHGATDVKGFFRGLATSASGVFKDIWHALFGGGGPQQGDTGARSGSAAVAQSYARSQLSRYGWGADQMAPLVMLWNQESGWSAYALNASSGAAGIAQSLGHGPVTLGDYVGQINWGLAYIRDRYGSPAAAWAHEQAYNWYAAGTRSARPGWAWVGELGPELVRMRGGETVLPAGYGTSRPAAGLGGGDTYVLNFPHYVGSRDDLVRAIDDLNRQGRLPKALR